ncbi:ABC-three component system middle component 5 [uncultured Amphritea sp.]|uniref:ABC-three component system middle component 5 n=1 Tax=uncultured Amphritea sp. TaxID=981605 RepID=UPI00262AFAD0|nr:ABC-three component system middle component 5 [uncultured Amphritea sp.]
MIHMFHPAKDINHIIYRVLLVMYSSAQPMELERLKVVCFYFVFPQYMKKIKPWPNDIKKYKKTVGKVKESFEHVGNLKKLFFDVSKSFDVAISLLVSKGIIDRDAFLEGDVFVYFNKVPAVIMEVIYADENIKNEVFEVLVNGLAVTPFDGINGLKARSGLVEYKYDQ